MTEVFDLEGASEYLKLAKSTMYKYIRLGVIPAFRVGRALRFKKEVLDDWMKAQSEASLAKPTHKRNK